MTSLFQAWTTDALAIGAFLTAVGFQLALAEGMRARGVRTEHTRKTVHVLGGLGCLGAHWLFTHQASAVLTALILAAVIESARWTGQLRGLYDVDRSSWGPTLFPLGVAAVIGLTWHAPLLYVGSLVVLTLGDAGAALVGERFGRRRYDLGGHERSLEGSATMLAVATLVGVFILAATGLPLQTVLIGGIALGLLCTALEGISPMGLDNVTVPVGAALFLLEASTPDVDPIALALGVVAAAAIAVVSLARRHLTVSGALAAYVFGFSLAIAGGPGWFLAALLVFAAVNVASKLKRSQKTHQAKGATRDHQQLLANAAPAIPAAIAYASTGHPVAVGAFVGAIAFAGADTLASEIGVLSSQPPRSIITGRRLAPGTSGGVSGLGYAAAAVGAGIPGIALAWEPTALQPQWVVIGLAAGVLGCTVDSVLGDLWQQKRRCLVCDASTELLDHCSRPTEHASGWKWLDNDAVNLLGSVSSAMVGMALVVGALVLGWA